eukprot:gene11484-15380_t
MDRAAANRLSGLLPPSLTELLFQNCSIGDVGLIEIFSITNLSNLTTLKITNFDKMNFGEGLSGFLPSSLTNVDLISKLMKIWIIL